MDLSMSFLRGFLTLVVGRTIAGLLSDPYISSVYLIFILKTCWLLVFMYPAFHLLFSAPRPCVDVTVGLDFSPKVPASRLP